MSKAITVNEDGTIPLWFFADIIDTDKVVSYKIKLRKNGSFIIKFYDKKGKLIKPYKVQK